MRQSQVRRRYPLHVHLSALFTALVLAAGAAIAWIGYTGSRDVALRAADETFSHIGRETQSSLREVLEPIGRLAQFLALHPVAHADSLSTRLESLPMLRLALDGDAPLTAVFLGYDDGSFLLLRRLESEADRQLFDAPEGAGYLVQSMETIGGDRAGGWVFFDSNLREIGRRIPAAYDFDPRTRPWYRLAVNPGQRVLTEPYAFHTAATVGVTVAVRTDSGSVVGLDVPLDGVSERLATLATLPGMTIALFDADRQVLAHSQASRPVVRREGDRVSLQRLEGFAEPVLATLAPVSPDDILRTTTVHAADRQWKAMVLPMQTVSGTLSLGIAVPLDTLLAGARAIRERALVATGIVLLIAIPLTGFVARRVSTALVRITRQAEDIRSFRFGEPSAGHSPVLEVDQLAEAMDMMRQTIRRFLDISTSLAAETNSAVLLERVVSETSATMAVAGGVAYLCGDKGRLEPQVLVGADGRALDLKPSAITTEDDSPVARAFLSGRTVVGTVPPGTADALDFMHRLWPGQWVGVTAIPLIDRARERVGVLALFQPGGVAPTPEKLAFVEALSGTAAVAIETQRLLEARKALLDALIRLIAGAIDAKSPYTGGHCERVPELTLMLARAACDAQDGPFRDFSLTEQEWEAVQIASWLHDCGKVTTPEYVVDKATKLETLHDRIHEVRMRFEVLKRDAAITCWQRIADGGDRAAALGEMAAEQARLDEEFAFVASCNEGGEFMDPVKVQRLQTIAARRWLRTLDDRIGISHEERLRKERTPPVALPTWEPLLADRPEHIIPRVRGEHPDGANPWGFRMAPPEHLYNRGELHNLTVARGTLTEEERYVINHHIVQTIVMLTQLPFPKHLKDVPDLAGGHHEKMDGTGYPRGLRAADMPPVARMMAIADIFEALTAADRPYKKPKTLSEAVRIMGHMKREHHIDPELFDLFLTSGVFRLYADRFLRPEQIDAVDIAPYLGPVAAASTAEYQEA